MGVFVEVDVGLGVCVAVAVGGGVAVAVGVAGGGEVGGLVGVGVAVGLAPHPPRDNVTSMNALNAIMASIAIRAAELGCRFIGSRLFPVDDVGCVCRRSLRSVNPTEGKRILEGRGFVKFWEGQSPCRRKTCGRRGLNTERTRWNG